MRVGFDARVLGPEAGGIGRYARGLIGALAAQAETERLDFECWLFGPSAPLGELARSRVKVEPRWGQVRSGLLRALWCLPWSLRARRVEVFHGLDHVGLPIATGKARGVLTVHDLIPLRLPELVTPRFRTVARLFFRRAVRRADAIIAVSERTRADLVE
ncbi:MAG: glycosyltransferase, partial [Deltaproteobacteria bacterium]|nr:glycosyltransferase [Deltaproteobacteria bacterium]